MLSPRRVGSLLEELQRRRVFRVAAGYSAAAFVVAQAAAVSIPALLLPEWTLRVLVMTLLLGFPVAVSIAWGFDLEPADGSGPAGETLAGSVEARGGEPTPRRARPLVLGVAALALLVAAGGTAFAGWRVAGVGAESSGPRSLAVLPFLDLSPEGDREYLSHGIAAEILTSLAAVPGVDVVGRSSSFQFKGLDPDVREVGRKLDVEAVLEGSVRSDGDRLRVAVQLTDTRTGYELWSASYDRRSTDVFGLQEEVARSVIASLPVGQASAAEIPRQPRTDPETYRLYLRGRYAWSKRSPESLERAEQLFAQTVAQDPGFAPAWAGRADALVALGTMGVRPRVEAVSEARELAERAVGLAPAFADGYASLAQALEALGERGEAERAYRRALDLNAGHATARHWYALLLTSMGRHTEALQHAEEAQRLDPLSLPARISTGVVLLGAGRAGAAVQHFEELRDEEPGAWSLLPYLSIAYSLEGRNVEAVEAARQAVLARPDQPDLRSFEIHALARAGRSAEAEAALESLVGAGGSAGAVGAAHASLGHDDDAFAALERARTERSEQLFFLLVDPRFDAVRDDPRFPELLKREQLPPTAR